MEKEPSLELNDIDAPLYDALGVDVMVNTQDQRPSHAV